MSDRNGKIFCTSIASLSHISKLAGREAEFYLLPKGLRALRDAKQIDASDTTMAAIYKDEAVSDEFVQYQLRIARVRNQLMNTYVNLQIFTARDIQQLDYFPKPRPALFLSMKNNNTISRFFVEYIPTRMSTSQVRKRCVYLTRYYNEGDWSDTNTPLPTLLFIAETKFAETTVRRTIGHEKLRSNVELECYTTITSKILEENLKDASIWQNIDYPDTYLSLNEI